MEAWDTSLKIVAEKCWATPTSDPRNAQKYIFIKDFCGDYYEESVYQSLQIFDNGRSTNILFSVKSFTWKDRPSSQLHFHCLVSQVRVRKL